MKQFFDENTAVDLAELELRDQAACIVFRDQELPPACVPARGRIGFEIVSNTGCARLYVERGVRYCGSNPTLESWFKYGEISFPNFAGLRRWIKSDLKEEFERSLDSITPATTGVADGAAYSKESAPWDEVSTNIDCFRHQIHESGVATPMLNGAILFAIKQLGRTYGLT